MKQSEKREAKRLRLIFIRHARAEELTPEISDYERSLTTRGKLHSRLMAQILKSRGEKPGKVISSPAFRALETALIFCRKFAIAPGSVEICPELYTGLDPDEYVPFIRRQSDDAGTITIVGHNPLITDMAVFFAADEPTDLPKTGIFCVSFNAGRWSEVEPDSGTTEYFLTPKTHL